MFAKNKEASAFLLKRWSSTLPDAVSCTSRLHVPARIQWTQAKKIKSLSTILREKTTLKHANVMLHEVENTSMMKSNSAIVCCSAGVEC